jgi:peroxiredoxin
MSNKISAGSVMPSIEVPTIDNRSLNLNKKKSKWTLLVVYRGLHCPICKDYARKLEDKITQFEELETELIFISADTKERANDFAEELALKSTVAYSLSIPQMKQLGLYLSDPRPNEIDYVFPEPGLFLINTNAEIHIVEISNAPFIRPDIDLIIRGINHIKTNKYPIRGTH